MGYIYIYGQIYFIFDPTISDNIILVSLCFDWHSGIMFVS